MFVFDEVDKMPEGLLNMLVPFLDYNSYHKSTKHSESMYQNKAIFIFLSNTGSTQIVQQLTNLWEKGKKRDETRLQDFERLIADGAFSENGGFHHSDAIQTSVIDHYVPFLPLEEVHVRKCLARAFTERGVAPKDEMIEEALSHLTFGPEPHNLYSMAGCKRIEQKVASIVYRKQSEPKAIDWEFEILEIINKSSTDEMLSYKHLYNILIRPFIDRISYWHTQKNMSNN